MGCKNENIGILITNIKNKEDKIIVSTWEKKVKNPKKLSKNYKSPQTVSTINRKSQISASLTYRENSFTETSKLAVYIWKYWCHAMNNSSEETLSDSNQIKEGYNASVKKHLVLKSLINALKKASAWEAFKVWEKLFVLYGIQHWRTWNISCIRYCTKNEFFH